MIGGNQAIDNPKGITAIFAGRRRDLIAEVTDLGGSYDLAPQVLDTMDTIYLTTQTGQLSMQRSRSAQGTVYQIALRWESPKLQPAVQAWIDADEALLLVVGLVSGDYVLLGADNYCYLRDVSAESGRSAGDRNGYVLNAGYMSVRSGVFLGLDGVGTTVEFAEGEFDNLEFL